MVGVLALLLGLVVAVLVGRVVRRERAILRRYPPLGRILRVAGRRVHALTMGEGPDLVVIHGASGQMRDMLPLMQRLAARFRVTAFDRPGLGHSDPLGPAGIAPAAQARHLAEAAGLLGLRNPIVLGQSYGGTVALAWGLEVTGALAAAALVLVSAPALPWHGKLDWWYQLTDTWPGRWLGVPLATALVTDAWLDGMIPGLFAPDAPPEGYAERIGAALALPRGNLDANALQVNGLLRHLQAMQPRYGELSLPVELVHGEHDAIVPLAIHAAPLAGLLPRASLTVLPGAGHMPHHAHPEAVVAATLRAAARAGWTWPPASA